MSDTKLAPNLMELSFLKSNVHNILINGGMEIWQRGNSFIDPSSLYTADMWWWSQSGVSTFTVSREATIKELGNYSMKCVWTGGTTLRVGQSPLSGVGVVGPITVKARVRSNQAGCRIMAFWSGGNYSGTVAHTGGDTFETLTATFQLTGNALALSIWIGWDSTYGTALPGSGTMYVDSVMAVWGTSVIDFVEDDPTTLLTRCQRFYEKSYVLNASPGTITATNLQYANGTLRNTNDVMTATIAFKVQKNGTPTVTLYTQGGTSGQWAWTNNAASKTNRVTTADAISTNGFNVRQMIAGTDLFGEGHWVAEST